jgi:hypothetical protein
MVRREPQIKDIAEVVADDAHEKDCLDSTQAADSSTFGLLDVYILACDNVQATTYMGKKDGSVHIPSAMSAACLI